MTVFETCFGPADFAGLRQRDLADTACVVFDVLRATTTAITALSNGARAIRPVSTVEEALAERVADRSVLLAGERGGRKIGAELTGGVAFDLGNSPREFGSEVVAGRTIAMTTTNGTRALKACSGAGLVVAGAWVNRTAAVRRVRQSGLQRVILVSSGTGEETALEDVLACGAFLDRWLAETGIADVEVTDSAAVAWGVWRGSQPTPGVLARTSCNARRLASMPDLAPDLGICLTLDGVEVVPVLAEGRELRSESTGVG